MTYVLARSVTQGHRAGMLSALGIATRSLVHTIAAAVGLSAILLHSQAAFLAIKYAGAAYLLYLAWRALRGRGTAAGPVKGRPPAPLARVYSDGVAINVMKPKVALFVLAFLPQFAEPPQGPRGGTDRRPRDAVQPRRHGGQLHRRLGRQRGRPPPQSLRSVRPALALDLRHCIRRPRPPPRRERAGVGPRPTFTHPESSRIQSLSFSDGGRGSAADCGRA